MTDMTTKEFCGMLLFTLVVSWIILGLGLHRLSIERKEIINLKAKYDKLEVLYEKQGRKYVSVTIGRNRPNKTIGTGR